MKYINTGLIKSERITYDKIFNQFEREFNNFLISTYPSIYDDEKLLAYISTKIKSIDESIETILAHMGKQEIEKMIDNKDLSIRKEVFCVRRMIRRLNLIDPKYRELIFD